jgi:dihydroxyacid dehydratase/phosphogluconate dehydratase
MDAYVFDKSKLPSRHVTEGPVRAPHGEFCTIAMTDGITMGQRGRKASLVSREVIADWVELTTPGHCYDAELADRRKQWKPRPTDYGSGAISKYAQTVGSAKDGAVTHPGFAGETHVYADL